MDVATLHSRSVAEFLSRLQAVGDQWEAPTPCSEWDVRALVNHVVAEDLWTAPLMGGASIDDVGDRFDGDVLGDDPLATARAAGEAAVTATASAVVAGRTVHLSFGDTPAEEYAYQLIADHLIHGWDLAAATGGDRSLDLGLVEALAAWYADREELYRSSGAVAERPSDVHASDPWERLLQAFGRHPLWAPAAS